MLEYKYYISGPMTGYPNFNYDAFDNTEERLIKSGNTCYNPAKAFEGKQNLDWILYMKNDYEMLLKCEHVLVIDGWDKSLGSILEVVYALSRGKRIYYLTDHFI